MFEQSRVVFNRIVKQYKEYLALYAEFNNGSTEGATPFADFYWRYTYYGKYIDSEFIKDRGY